MKWLNAAGLVTGFVGAALLFSASRSVPWGKRTIGGHGPAEKEFDRRRAAEARLGFVLLGVSFVLQLVATLGR